MKYNIKEILDLDIDIDDKLAFINYIDDLGNKHEYETINAEQLLDYITNLQDTLKDREEYCYGLETQLTNLQEENKRLKEIVENLTTMTVCGDRKQIKNTSQYKLEEYKSRNEKAINLLNNEDIVVKLQEFENKYTVNFYDKKVDLLNILKGE